MSIRTMRTAVVVIITVLRAFHVAGQDSLLYLSPETQAYIRTALHPPDRMTIQELNGLKASLEIIEDKYNKQIAPYNQARDNDNGFLTLAVKGIIEDVPFFGGVVEKWDGKVQEEAANLLPAFSNEKLFGQNSAMNSFYVSLRQSCNNDAACIERGADAVAGDPRVQQLLAGHPEISDRAKIKELIVANTKQAEAQQGQVIQRFDNMAALTTAFASLTTTQLTILQGTQQILINNTADIINTQQKHTIALTRIQASINANQAELKKRLDQGFGTVIGLQLTNIFLTDMVLEHTNSIEGKLDQAVVQLGRIESSVDTIRSRQLDQIYNESPLQKKLRMLEGSEGKELITDSLKRKELIENVKVMIDQERLVAVTKKVREWGLVSLEALNVFYPDCPDGIKKTVSVAITASDIVGGIASGNYSQAIMAGLSLFKKPTPGPEMQLLQKITQQLTSLESNMNAQFRAVHEQLFAMEQNLATRMEIVDQKLDMISEQIGQIHAELSEGLLSLNSKLSYVTGQNQCTQNLILEIFRSDGVDICQGPVKEFKKRVAEGGIKSLQDLQQFFIGQQCKSCIEALFKNSSQNLLNSELFQYSKCSIPTGTANRPDNLYDYIFTYLVPDSIKNSPYGIFSLMYPSADVARQASSASIIDRLPDSVKLAIRQSYQSFTWVDNDRQYRQFTSVLELVDNVLTMLPFLELYNDGGLMTQQLMTSQPEITRERSKKIIGYLDNLSQLIDHTIVQQSIIAGMGSFAAIDNLMTHGDVTSPSELTLSNLFDYDPLLAKNYSAYFFDRRFGGLSKLTGIRAGNPFTRIGKYYEGGNSFETLVVTDDQQNWTLETRWSSALNKKPIFRAYLPPVKQSSDTTIYSTNLVAAIPESLSALYSARLQVNMLSAEMRFIVSDEMDKPGALLTRSDFDQIIRSTKNQ